jgi:chromosome segregation ATPase
VSRPDRRAFERVRFLEEAAGDLRALARRSRPVLVEAFRLLKRLDLGQLTPTPLHDYSKTGDLSDCGKIVVAVDGEPEYRIVVREVDGGVEVVDVIAVEERTADLPYLMAGLRLGRITDPVRRSDAQRRVARIRRHLDG